MENFKKFKAYFLPVLFLALAAYMAGRSYASVEVFSFSVNQKVVLIDAGHGGWDAWWNRLLIRSGKNRLFI